MFELFLELHRGLPRQGPGSREHTLQALEAVPDLPGAPRIIDLGCGPGAHTVDLLTKLPDATVVAVDQLPVMLDELRRRAVAAGVADRLETVEGDMVELPAQVNRAWFHLVWSEAAIYAVGFDRALAAWRHLLVPGGFIAVSDLVWTGPVDAVPEAARAFWAEEYPAMRSEADNRAAFEAAGYELAASFRLPASAWQDEYYRPLLARLPDFEAAHPNDEHATEVAQATRREAEVVAAHHEAFAYVFYVGRMR